jgi:hypothetical protein
MKHTMTLLKPTVVLSRLEIRMIRLLAYFFLLPCIASAAFEQIAPAFIAGRTPATSMC